MKANFKFQIVMDIPDDVPMSTYEDFITKKLQERNIEVSQPFVQQDTTFIGIVKDL